MLDSKSYRQFRINVRPSPGTNDHEVRFVADGADLIASFWNDMMGLDPDDVLVRPCPLRSESKPRRATIARCGCGVIECDSVEVEIVRLPPFVGWTWRSPKTPVTLRFLAASYDAEIERAVADTSWQTPDRTAARLLAEQVDRRALARSGLSFSWASGRIRKGTFTVALKLEPGPYQVLIHFPWNRESPEEIARHGAGRLALHPADWARVEWFASRPDLGPPPLAGPSWRRGGA